MQQFSYCLLVIIIYSFIYHCICFLDRNEKLSTQTSSNWPLSSTRRDRPLTFITPRRHETRRKRSIPPPAPCWSIREYTHTTPLPFVDYDCTNLPYLFRFPSQASNAHNHRHPPSVSSAVQKEIKKNPSLDISICSLPPSFILSYLHLLLVPLSLRFRHRLGTRSLLPHSFDDSEPLPLPPLPRPRLHFPCSSA